VNTVGQHGSEKVIAAYVQGQGGNGEYCQFAQGAVGIGSFLTNASGLAPRFFTFIEGVPIEELSVVEDFHLCWANVQGHR